MNGDISPDELARWRKEEKEFVLLDVREPVELQLASLPGALEIPMNDVPARIGELPKDRPIAVICHHGGRSESVVAYLHSRGFVNAVNVDGGIDAYARRVDPSMRRY
jgi:rhodanese-related sulfurtransferase